MHNVRVMWLKATKYEEIPSQLDRATVTPAQALRGLEGSCQALSVVLARAIAGDGQIRNFRPDVSGFFGYLIAHDAHHRGQITMLAARPAALCRKRPCSACGSGDRADKARSPVNRKHRFVSGHGFKPCRRGAQQCSGFSRGGGARAAAEASLNGAVNGTAEAKP